MATFWEETEVNHVIAFIPCKDSVDKPNIR